MTQTVQLSNLGRADGSASYSSNGCTVIAAVNGPIEVQRRDELPEEAAVDVAVRPATGVGGSHYLCCLFRPTLTICKGVRERHLESIVQRTLRQVILISAHPRTLIQIILQIVTTQETQNTSFSLHQSASNLPVLPALLQASIFALLSTSIPLIKTLTSTLIAISPGGDLVAHASTSSIQEASSIHVLAFSSLGELLVNESEGNFAITLWEEVFDKASLICRGSEVDNMDGDVSMGQSEGSDLETSLKEIMESKVRIDQEWRRALG
ncbi:MAG: hypothetical protein Q9167_004358 [Letrouitia subvulpina]